MREALDGHAEIMRWLLLSPIVQSMTVFELWDDDAFHALASRAVRLARDTGALALLPVALIYQAGVQLFGGELAAASALIREADAISVATGNAPLELGAPLLRSVGRDPHDHQRPMRPSTTRGIPARSWRPSTCVKPRSTSSSATAPAWPAPTSNASAPVSVSDA